MGIIFWINLRVWYQIMKVNNTAKLKKGMIDGLPIAIGYLAVSFSLGIQAKNAGINSFYATLMSLTNVTSAGQFAAIGIIKEQGTYIEIAISTLVINLRYMLMSCALSQKISGQEHFKHRLFMAFGITDEIFGISIGQEGMLNPFYTYGAMLVAIPGWCLGTFLGVICGDALPLNIVRALSIALYGMFIAIIIPPARKDRVVAIAVVIAMVSSFIWTKIPAFNQISSGTKVIVLTVVISLLFAIICPVRDEEGDIANES